MSGLKLAVIASSDHRGVQHSVIELGDGGKYQVLVSFDKEEEALADMDKRCERIRRMSWVSSRQLLLALALYYSGEIGASGWRQFCQTGHFQEWCWNEEPQRIRAKSFLSGLAIVQWLNTRWRDLPETMKPFSWAPPSYQLDRAVRAYCFKFQEYFSGRIDEKVLVSEALDAVGMA
jgi:hypothetical protein